MAWVTQKFEYMFTRVELDEHGVSIVDGDQKVYIAPGRKEEAHSQAMMLRRAARRLEEIGKELS